MYATSCVRNNPIFRRIAQAEDQKRAKAADEAIAKSPVLQELDHLCTKEIPLFAGFEANGRFTSYPQKTALHYYYRSPAAYSSVKQFYVKYFANSGWTLTLQDEDTWGPDRLQFKKDTYRVTLNHGGLGDADYAIDCDKL